jgi:hypothetical protein
VLGSPPTKVAEGAADGSADALIPVVGNAAVGLSVDGSSDPDELQPARMPAPSTTAEANATALIPRPMPAS